MSYPALSTTLQSTEEIGRGATRDNSQDSQPQSPHTPLVHILDDDSLLHVFYLYRPALFRGERDDEFHIVAGNNWIRERWWYKLAHVCRRWRNLILGSAPYLGVCLVCTHGTPVADMLEHSPSLPLFIDYHLNSEMDTTMIAEVEEGISLALKQCDRVRRIRFRMPFPIIQKLVEIIEGEYPVLEYLIMSPSTTLITALRLSETFRAPHLRHLTLKGIGLPIGSRLLTTAVGIVALSLFVDNPSVFIQPLTLLQWLSFMPQLETLCVDYHISSPDEEVNSQLMHAPAMTHVTFPNLRWFEFLGDKAYMEAIVYRIAAPRLEKLSIKLIFDLSLPVPGLLQFMDTTENLRFDSADFEFCKFCTSAKMYLRGRPKVFVLSVTVIGFVLDVQVTSMAQIFNSLGQKLSTVEYLTLDYEDSLEFKEFEYDRTSWRRTAWRNLLGSFGNVKTLRVNEELVETVSHCLQVDEGGPSLELLPELQRLSYSAMGDTYGPFKSFIDTRKKAGRPVTLISRSSSGSSQGSSDSSSVITSRSSEAGSSEAGSDESGSDEAGSDEVGSSERGSDEAGSSEAGSDESGSDEAGSGSSETESDEAGSDGDLFGYLNSAYIANR